jgi:hypothetical protein
MIKKATSEIEGLVDKTNKPIITTTKATTNSQFMSDALKEQIGRR